MNEVNKKICSNCGGANSIDSLFCMQCGTKLEGSSNIQVSSGGSAVKTFEADVYVLTKEEGGRSTPFFSNYRPQFRIENNNISGIITLSSGSMLYPGNSGIIKVQLATEALLTIGVYFEIYEGDILIGKGTVTKIS